MSHSDNEWNEWFVCPVCERAVLRRTNTLAVELCEECSRRLWKLIYAKGGGEQDGEEPKPNYTPPRYDDVYEQGVEYLDARGEEPGEEEKP